MHPDNIYLNNPPDFIELAENHPDFRQYVTTYPNGTSSIDFKNPAALRELTRSLLHRDFALSLTFPTHRLCPTLTNRLDYIYHLLSLSKYIDPDIDASTGEGLRVIDIGTGASAIYPILLSRLRGRVKVIGTEIDGESLKLAEEVIEGNGLAGNVTLMRAEEGKGILYPLTDLDTIHHPFTFTMCNPPFYSSREEILASTELKVLPAHASPTASTNELLTPGGELQFISTMIQESLQLNGSGCGCRWFTSLVGKSSSLGGVLEVLKQNDIDNYFLLSIRQALTTRWIIGWSFTDIRLPDDLTRIYAPSTAKHLPKANKFTYNPPPSTDIARLRLALLNAFSAAGLPNPETTEATPPAAILEFEGGNTWNLAPRLVSWSRAARRLAQRGILGQVRGSAEQEPIFRCRIEIAGTVRASGSIVEETMVIDDNPTGYERRDTSGLTLILNWTRGKDRAVLEAFWAFLTRKVGDFLRDDEDGRGRGLMDTT